MIDIQNATLAGGVAMGTCANIHILPVYSIAIGVISGCVSIYCYAKLQGILERKIRLHDSCGVLNLHGLPGFLGAVFGVIACLGIHQGFDKNNQKEMSLLLEVFLKANESWWNLRQQALIQCEYIFISLGISIITGIFSGIIINYLGKSPKLLFDDNENFRIPSVHYEEADKFYTKIQMLMKQQNFGDNQIGNDENFKKQLLQNLLNSEDKQTQNSINNKKNQVQNDDN
ncbi:rh-associated glycoprotein, putative [Ichthyophthirius multifiliis]|uniref:Rh-associated glycoprotein, putative n=1 Tax=Ichthyophthirius multifiliis TaxID=5932 RepID=G0QS90_ICHMU|nr:rh-associated glycoprotein, putative [Ichthyophthirius multifiliis]EGR31912.1 rh-associated glycoprotein, putative [Ichthyophthirius multifiliis]|eukprot:XP_004035398.1 rh-associated glycoprotein, putative [Ichthyophthirius multifiliis]